MASECRSSARARNISFYFGKARSFLDRRDGGSMAGPISRGATTPRKIESIAILAEFVLSCNKVTSRIRMSITTPCGRGGNKRAAKKICRDVNRLLFRDSYSTCSAMITIVKVLGACQT